MHSGGALLHAINMTLVMSWEIFWALVLGFALSRVIQAVVSKREMSRLLPDSSPGSILEASVLGAASSCCSYAATAIARSIFRTDGDCIAALIVSAVLVWRFMRAGGREMLAAMEAPGGHDHACHHHGHAHHHPHHG
jgi:uncharacterized membrane protein YraQ (UPF0718 family)